MSTSTQLMTAEELIRLPRGQYRYELVNGELITMSPAGHDHGRVTLRIASPLSLFVWDQKLGEVFAAETGFKLTSNPDTVLAPDVCFIKEDRAKEQRKAKGYWPGPPDLAVEVFGPDERKAKVQAKALEWLRYGTTEVWLVDLRHETVSIYRSDKEVITLTIEQELSGGNLIPGFRLPLSEVFVL
jgi:Uma2 family endonuclease